MLLLLILSTAYAVGEGGKAIYYTMGSWYNIDAISTNKDLFTVGFFGDTLGWIAGADGTLYKYYEGVWAADAVFIEGGGEFDGDIEALSLTVVMLMVLELMEAQPICLNMMVKMDAVRQS